MSITGPGGSGKTRLALEVSRRLAPAYRQRVAFVPLESVDDPERIASTLVRALGLSCSPEDDPLERAAEALGADPCLLVLDNFEQLLARSGPADARAVVRRTLGLIPSVRCLITSRQALATEGERELRLAPLSTPSAAGAGSESVTLFVERVHAVDPTFGLTAGNRGEVEALCDRLEGLPLAIEMAAAWTRMLPLRALCERLESEPTGLATRRKDIPERHRSLRAVLEWSCHLLNPELRRAFAALSVFRGGWSLQAAEAVVGPGALDLLADLEERSLLVVEEQRSRYRYLESVREFARERLRERGEDEARARHAGHYLALAKATARRSPGLERAGWMELAREYPNLHTALEWLVDSGRTRELAELVADLVYFWLAEGHRLREGASWAERALALYAPRDAVRADVLSTAALLALRHGLIVRALERYEESLSVADEAGDRRAAAAAILGLARTHAEAGHTADTKRYVAECVAALRDLGDDSATADGLLVLAFASQATGDTAEQERLLTDAASISQTAGLRHYLAQALYGLAILARDRGDPDTARALWLRCVALDEEVGIRGGGALWGLGMLAGARGDGVEAARWYRRSLCENLESAHPEGAAEGFQSLAGQARQSGSPDRSARLLGAALRQWSDADRGFRARRKEIDALTQELRDQLGAERCEALLQEGWRMEPEAAIELGLAHLNG